jgi:hypothetical protein
LAIAQHVSGTVVVQIRLDEQSRIVSGVVVSSPSPLLNGAALAAARESTFATAIRGCVPVADTYNFVVFFQPSDAPPIGPPASMTAYFSGGWSCATKLGSFTLRLFGLNLTKTALQAANAFVDANGSLYQTSDTYTQQGDVISAIQCAGYNFSGTSSGWSGDRLVFHGVRTTGQTAVDQTMTYERIDADRFVRTFAVSNGDGAALVVTSSEECRRIPTAVYR